MKLLITGATGKLGAKVVETLLKTVPANNYSSNYYLYQPYCFLNKSDC